MPSSQRWAPPPTMTWEAIASSLQNILQAHANGDILDINSLVIFLNGVIHSKEQKLLRGVAPACILDGLLRLGFECETVSLKCGECIIRLVGEGDGWERYGRIAKCAGLGKVLSKKGSLLIGNAWVEAVEEAVSWNDVGRLVDDGKCGRFGIGWGWLVEEVESGRGDWELVGDKVMLKIVKRAVKERIGGVRWRKVIERVVGGFRRIDGKVASLLDMLDQDDDELGGFGLELKAHVNVKGIKEKVRNGQGRFFAFEMQRCMIEQGEDEVPLNFVYHEAPSLAEFAAVCSLPKYSLGMAEDLVSAWMDRGGRFETYALIAYALKPDHHAFDRFRKQDSFDGSVTECNLGLPHELESPVDVELGKLLTVLISQCEELCSSLLPLKVNVNCEIKDNVGKELKDLCRRHPWLVRRRAKRIASVVMTVLIGLDNPAAIYKIPNIRIVNTLMDVLGKLPIVITEDVVLRASLEGIAIALEENRKINGIPEHMEGLSFLLISSLKLLTQTFQLPSNASSTLMLRIRPVLSDLESLVQTIGGSRSAWAAAREFLDKAQTSWLL